MVFSSAGADASDVPSQLISPCGTGQAETPETFSAHIPVVGLPAANYHHHLLNTLVYADSTFSTPVGYGSGPAQR